MEATAVTAAMEAMAIGKRAGRTPMQVIAPERRMRNPGVNARGTEERMLDIRLLTWSLGLFAAVSFVLCVAYGLIAPEPLHMHGFLEAVLPGFRWLTVPGFLIGLVESFLYGVYAGLAFGWIHNALARRISSAG